MFCQKCGKEMSNGVTICMYCGEQQGVQPIQNTTGTKDNLLLMLRTSANYQNKVWPYINKAVDFQEEQKKTASNIAGTKQSSKMALVSGVICLIVGILFFAWGQSMTRGLSSILSPLIVIGGIVTAIIGIISMLRFPVLKGKAKKYEELLPNIDANLNRAWQELDQFNAIPEIAKERAIFFQTFPKGDVMPEDVAFILNSVETGRANTMQEALRLFDEHKHRQRLEKAINQQTAYARQTAINSAMAAAEASRAADNAANAADWSMRNTLFK